MKYFILFIFKLLIVLFVSAYILDFAYTYVYSKSSKRNKIENIINAQPKTFDVIMLGSSRANNHFDAKIFQDNGYKAFNFGMSGSVLEEAALMLQLMIEKKYIIKNIIVEIDLNIIANGSSKGTQARFMPFLRSEKTISNYYKSRIPEFKNLFYIPFYRYIAFDAEIGFREMCFSLSHKSSKNLENFGFTPLVGHGENMQYDLTNVTPKQNDSFDLIRQICKDNNINLFAVSTPMCKNVKGLNYFTKIKNIYPEVLNYENAITDDKYFSSCGHLNEEGAQILTTKILNDLFLKRKV